MADNYSGHISIGDIILGPNSHYPLELISLQLTCPITFHIRHFLEEIWIHFTLENALKFHLIFQSVRSIKIKIYSHFQSVFTSMVDRFPNCKDVQNALRQDRNMDTITEISVSHGQPPILQSENQQDHSNSILVHFDQHFHTLQTLANQRLPNYHINMISSNILPLGSFFPHCQLLDTLQGRLHYTLTPQSRFLKQNKPI